MIYLFFIPGYVLSYKRDQGGWEEIALSPEQTEFVLSGLKCGSSYLAHLTAHNRVDTGDPSPLISATTKGTGKLDILRAIKISYKIKLKCQIMSKFFVETAVINLFSTF